jgi:TIR domain
MGMTADVFISYRGADRALARKLEQRLRSRWGSRVFRDETGLQAGTSWQDELAARLKDASVVIALVGPGWSVSTNPADVDWVRNELVAAIERGTPILPVLVGDPDVLKAKLGSLPAAFTRQAIVVPEGIPLSSVLDIVQALRQLGAFDGAEPLGLAAGRAELVSELAHAQCTTALTAGRSIFAEGGGGSGRAALLRRLIADRTTGEKKRFVAVCGLDGGDAGRSTHAVMGSWFATLCRAIEQEPLRRDRLMYGRLLVEAVLACGPDLVSRRVIPVGLLLPLGDDSHDHQVLVAARRPTERWAPYPPRRMVIQARALLERFVETADIELDLVVADVDAVDASSRDLMADLLRSSSPISLIFAASSSPEDDQEALGRLLPATRHARPTRGVERVKLDDPAMWGESGSPLPQWLKTHHILLDDALLRHLAEANPYYALSRLWYLTDRGFVAEEVVVDGRVDEGGLTRWKLAVETDVPQPTHSALLNHMLDEYVPTDLQTFVQIGALAGRTFPFEVVYRAWIDEPRRTANDGEPGVSKAATEEAMTGVWERLARSDPDNMVLACSEPRDGEKFVTFALDDLIAHIIEKIAPQRRVTLHARLAKAFADTESAVAAGHFEVAFRSVAFAAEHWEKAGGSHLRVAADAHRRAAQFAEKALAYREAEHHYRVAIRLLAQLIADMSDTTHDHEDLLIVANCQYRLGQMVRMSGQFTDEDTGSPEQHFNNALQNLNGLRGRLRSDEFVAVPGMATMVFARDDIPGPDRIQHLLRVCDALSGYITLDRATWLHEFGEREQAREALFETLRCAELAAGEADSRWLLAAASARLAESLADQAIAIAEGGGDDHRSKEKAHDLAVEALFYVERVVGLRANTLTEETDLAEPKALARDVFGRLATQLHGRPRLAEWVYRKLNTHRPDLRVAEDMSTDFRLGQFLLSIVTTDRVEPTNAVDRRWVADPIVNEAQALLTRYAVWARESGLREALGPALNRLALVELVRAGGFRSAAALKHLSDALIDPLPGSHAESLLLLAFAAALPGDPADGESVGLEWVCGNASVDAFREAIALLTGTSASGLADEAVLLEGWNHLAHRLLSVCPALGLIVVEDADGVARLTFAAADDALNRARQRAHHHVERVEQDPPMSPVHDHVIKQLAQVRLSRRALMQKAHVLRIAKELFDAHEAMCVGGESADRDVLWRDLRWATYVYDWYDDVEPARLLVLAAEWHKSVTGAQWASPQLLRGPLAIELLRNQFDAELQLGTERYRRIARLVEHRGVGSVDGGPLEMVFLLATELAEIADGEQHGPSHWSSLARRTGCLSEAFHLARAERVADLAAFGRPVQAMTHEAAEGYVIFDPPGYDSTELTLTPA